MWLFKYPSLIYSKTHDIWFPYSSLFIPFIHQCEEILSLLLNMTFEPEACFSLLNPCVNSPHRAEHCELEAELSVGALS